MTIPTNFEEPNLNVGMTPVHVSDDPGAMALHFPVIYQGSTGNVLGLSQQISKKKDPS